MDDRAAGIECAMMAATRGTTYLVADRVVPATGGSVIESGIVAVADGRITAVGTSDEVVIPAEAQVQHYPGGTIVPGFVDAHCHVTLAGDSRTYEQMAQDRDEMMALVAVRNLQLHLQGGVTTLRDNGGRNAITFAVREAMERGYCTGPRMLLAGRPVTPTAGHFHWCGGVADGVEAIRAAVRRLVAEGADHIKIMASGGGTAGNLPYYPSYDARELRAAVEAAHALGRRTTAHCRAKASIANALEAGLDCLEHAEFLVPNELESAADDPRRGHWQYDHALGAQIMESGTFVSFTLQPGYDAIADLQGVSASRELTDLERRLLAKETAYFEQKLAVFSSLREEEGDDLLLVSSDAGPFDVRFGRFHLVLETAVLGGMTPLEAIEAATRRAATACGVADDVGTLEAGKFADLCVIQGNPLDDIRHAERIEAVFIGGRPVSTLLDGISSRLAREFQSTSPTAGSQ